MNRFEKINSIRSSLSNGKSSIGSWMQIPNTSVAEIMGQAGYDWVAIDLEHGAICVQQLPDIFRALELGDTLPLVRLAQGKQKECKQALDSGAGGVIVPMVETAEQLIDVRNYCCWPPAGKRGVGFSRANLFGERFENYIIEAQAPLLVAMIENTSAIDNLDEILEVGGLDAILIGPYDLSASMGITAKFNSKKFVNAMDVIKKSCLKYEIACGIHIVKPDTKELEMRINEGYQFIPYSIDAVFLNSICENPVILSNT
jgi:2-dehydro-3-deoxyglucarate aldolase